jgi:hypothetical protein
MLTLALTPLSWHEGRSTSDSVGKLHHQLREPGQQHFPTLVLYAPDLAGFHCSKKLVTALDSIWRMGPNSVLRWL